ncbi:MAG: tetratricopeptide repeat protein [Gemmatimonadaceae bacterium]
MSRLFLLLVAMLAAAGCAYFNGVYNARQAAERADRMRRDGEADSAAAAYALAAASAETVLVRYPDSRWRVDALFIAGRATALTGECGRATQWLRLFLAETREDDARCADATLALGRCQVELGDHAGARETLAPLLGAAPGESRSQAALWASRAARAMGEDARADAYLDGASADIARRERARAAMSRQDYAVAESLFALGAGTGALSEDVLLALPEIWRAGRESAVMEIVRRYEGARVPPSDLARLHVLAAALNEGSGSDSVAAAHLRRAGMLAADSALRSEVLARLAALAIRDMSSLVDMNAEMSRFREEGARGATWRRLERLLLMITLLDARHDPAGASRFLAAELARDSLDARLVAHALMRSVAQLSPEGSLAAKALLAAADLVPDSADVYRARVLSLHADSPYAYILRGRDPAAAAEFGSDDTLLRRAWRAASDAMADTLRSLAGPAADSGRPSRASPGSGPPATP